MVKLARNPAGGGYTPPVEILDMIPIPENGVSGNATRGDYIVTGVSYLQGGTYYLKLKTTFNRICIYPTARTVGSTLALHIFQVSGGRINAVMPRVATVRDFVPVAGQVNFLTPTEGTVTLDAGVILVLWGNDSSPLAGSFTMQTYISPTNRILNDNAALNPVGGGVMLHPSAFLTALVATVSPASVNPFVTNDGGNMTPTTIDTVLQLRLKKV